VDSLVHHLDNHIISHPGTSPTPFKDLFTVKVRTIDLCICTGYLQWGPGACTQQLYASVRSSTPIRSYAEVIKHPLYYETLDLCPIHRDDPKPIIRHCSFEAEGKILLLVFDDVPNVENTRPVFNVQLSPTKELRWMGDVSSLGPQRNIVFRDRSSPHQDIITGLGVVRAPRSKINGGNEVAGSQEYFRAEIAVYRIKTLTETVSAKKKIQESC
jgi:hypothetical protein